MKFLKEDGTIEDGTPITDEQIRLREVVVNYLHETMCHNVYHSPYMGDPLCVKEGRILADHLDQFNGESRLCDVLHREMSARSPQVITESQPIHVIEPPPF